MTSKTTNFTVDPVADRIGSEMLDLMKTSQEKNKNSAKKIVTVPIAGGGMGHAQKAMRDYSRSRQS